MTTPTPPSTGSAVWLVAEREISSKLRSKAFVVSALILFAMVLAGVLFSGFSASNASNDRTEVAATPEVATQLRDLGFEVTEVADRAAAETAVRDGEVAGAVLSGGDTQIGLTVLGLEDAPSDVIGALSVQPTVELLQVAELNPFLVYLVGIGFGIVFMMSAVTFGATIAQSVVEEKQTRIVEILMAAVPVRQLLAGKILGNSILAIGQVIIILVIAAVGLLATGQDLVLGELGESLVWFGVFFALGFVLLASLFATAASLVSRQEDVGSVTSPLMMLIMVPYVLVIAFNDNDLVMTIMSYVPFSAPVGMPMRLFMGTADWWEPLVSLVILVVSTVLVILLGAKIYSNSILRTGARVSLKEALAG